MQGIRDLKFNPDENTYEDVAKSYKDEGNFHFKAKKYRLAVANYTEGLRLKVPGLIIFVICLNQRCSSHSKHVTI